MPFRSGSSGFVISFFMSRASILLSRQLEAEHSTEWYITLWPSCRACKLTKKTLLNYTLILRMCQLVSKRVIYYVSLWLL